jgi:accessory gene regulator B
MNFIDKSALSIARAIRRNYPDAGSETVLKYSLSLIINTLTSITTILFICLLTGRFFEGLLTIVLFLALRFVSGGMHMNTSLSCCLLSIVVLTTIAHVQFNYFYWGVLLDSATVMILLRLAPQGIEQVSRIDPKHYSRLKIISVAMAASNFMVHSSLVSAVFFTQALTLTKPAYQIVELLERRSTK